MKAALLVLALASTVTLAQAGQNCEASRPTTAEVVNGLELAQAVQQALQASGAEVALIARAGQDLSRHGLRWSHLGFAYREAGPGQAPRWRVLHKLNFCGTARGELFRQGLGEFFLDKPHRYEASVQPLAPWLQQQLLPLLQSDAAAAALHQPHYSMVAYAQGLRYQQSNQWLLETLAAAAAPALVQERWQAQQWLRQSGYQPGVLQLDAMTRLGARVAMPHVAFDDHPSADRYAGRIATVTVESVQRFVSLRGLGQMPTVLRLPAVRVPAAPPEPAPRSPA